MDQSSKFSPETVLALQSPACLARALTAQHSLPFQGPPHVGLMDQMVTDLIRRMAQARILVIEAPPRHGKSELIAKWLPTWFLCRWPEKRVILASYEHGFARTWGRKARALLEEFGGQFGVRVSDAQSAASDWETSQGGGMLTAGAGGPMTGRGADLLIIDDPIKNAEEAVSETIRNGLWDWWQSTASTRIEPGGKVVIIATRWHEDDLSGRLIRDAETGEGEPILRLRMPALAEENDVLGRQPGEALWPVRYDVKTLEQTRSRLDIYWWLALYQQRPGRQGRSEWPDEYFEDIWADRWPDVFEISAIGIDPSKGKSAKRGDFSAIVFVGISGGMAWVDASIERRPTERIIADGIQFLHQTRPDVVSIESNNFQEEVAKAFEAAAWNAGFPGLPVLYTQNTGNKELRLQWKLGPKLATKKIRFRQTPGCRLLVEQLREFPIGDHDDGPDAMEMAFNALDKLTVESPEPEFARA